MWPQVLWGKQTYSFLKISLEHIKWFMNDIPMHARLHTHCISNPPQREKVSPLVWLLLNCWSGILSSSGDLMVHTASVLLRVPFPEVQPDITQTQKVTMLNYLRRQRCLAPLETSWGKKWDQLYLHEGQEYYRRKRNKVFHLFIWKEAESKSLGGKKNHLQSPSALNKTTTHFFSELQLWLALESALNQWVHPSWVAWHPQGLPLISGALYQKLFWPQKKCLRNLPSQRPTSAHPLVPLSSPGSDGVGLPNPSQWNSQMASLIIFKGSFRTVALTFISSPNLLPFL